VVEVLQGRPGRVIWTLGVSGLGNGMLTVSLPLYLVAVHATPAEIGATLSMFGVGMLTFEFLWGWLADRFGVPIPLIVSRFLFAGAMIGFAFARTIPEFAILYLLSSGMSVAGGPLGRSFLGVSLPHRRRGVGLGLHTSMANFTTALGAVLAGVMTDWFGVGSVFQVAWIFPFLSSFVALTAFRGQYRLKLTHILAQGGSRPTTDQRFSYWYAVCAISIVVTLMLVGQSGERSFLPLLITVKLARPATDAGLAVAVLGLFGSALMIPGGTISDRFGRKPAILAGMAFSFAGLLIYALAAAYWVVMLATGVRALGNALARPAATALIADTTPRSRQGMVMGVYGEFENVGMMAGPVVAGYVWGAAGISAAFAAIAASVAAGLLLAIFLIRENAWRRRAADAVVEVAPA
jgi:MFS transporter, DHA1 family, tetracycline resistance protein